MEQCASARVRVASLDNQTRGWMRSPAPRGLREDEIFLSRLLACLLPRLSAYPTASISYVSSCSNMESIHGNPPQRDLFSRGSSPPQQAPVPFAAHPNASSSQLDSLLQNLTSPTSEQPPSTNFANPSSASFATPSNLPQPFTGSGPGTPVMSMDAPRDSPASHHSGSMTTAERQSALLSLLNQPMSGVNVHRTGGSTGSLPQQVSTPPEPSQRSGASPTHNEAQGKILLEQLMAG